MPRKKDNTKITEEKPCFKCGRPALCFGWEPAQWIFCKRCSPSQKQRLKFETLEALRDIGIDVSIWGE